MALTPVGASLALLLLVAQNPQAFAWTSFNPLNLFGQNTAALASAVTDPKDLLAQRSPGARDPNALYSIKPEQVVALADLPKVVPHERVLSVVRDRPTPGLGPLAPADAIPSLFPAEPLAFGAPGFAVPGVSDLFPGDSTSPGSPGGPSGPSFGGPPVSLIPEPPTDAPPTEVDVPSAVPEPSTWLMNIVGFFAIAGMLRYRRRRIVGNTALRLA